MIRVAVATCVHHPLDARIHARQIEALVRARHEVVYAAPFSDTATPFDTRLECHDLPRAVGMNRLKAVDATMDWLRDVESRVDVILVHDIEVARKLGRLRTRAAKVWDVHENNPAAISGREYLPSYLRRLVKYFVIRAEAKAEKRLRLILAETSYQERFARQHPIVLNVPWVDPQARPAESAEVQQQVIYVGSLTATRGINELAQLATALQADGIEICLVGSIDDEAASEILSDPAKNVRWLSRLPNHEAMAEVRTSIAGIALLRKTPNFIGSMPTKVLEYMAQGTPVITTELPLAAEVVLNHDAGIVVPFGDIQAAADAVRKLATDPQLRQEMGQRGFTAAVEHYNWNQASLDFVTLIEDWAAAARQ